MKILAGPGRPAPHPRRAAGLWLLLLGLHASLYLFLISERRAGRGPAAGLLSDALLLIPGVLSDPGARIVFDLRLFLEELIFLLGVWLLAASVFEDPRTVFFVAAAALGSSLWVDQPLLNFRLYFTLPLTLHLARRYVAKGSPWILFALLDLSAVQALGMPPHLILVPPVTGLILLVASRRIFEDPARVGRGAPPPCRAQVGAALGGAGVWLGAVLPATWGWSRAAPAPSWAPSALAMTGLDAPGGLLDLGAGIAPTLEGSLFCGYFTLGFAALGLCRFETRKALALLAAAAAVAIIPGLLAATTACLLRVPSAAPPSAVGAPILRLLVVLLAGVGFESLLRGGLPPGQVRGVGAALLLLAVALVGVSLGVQFQPGLPGAAAALFCPGRPQSISPVFSSPVVCELLDASAFGSGIAGGTLLLTQSRARAVPLAIALILLLHPLDVFGWKFRMSWILTQSREAQASGGERTSDRPEGTPSQGIRPAGSRPSSLATGLLGLNGLAWAGWALWESGSLARALRPERGTR